MGTPPGCLANNNLWQGLDKESEPNKPATVPCLSGYPAGEAGMRNEHAAGTSSGLTTTHPNNPHLKPILHLEIVIYLSKIRMMAFCEKMGKNV